MYLSGYATRSHISYYILHRRIGREWAKEDVETHDAQTHDQEKGSGKRGGRVFVYISMNLLLLVLMENH